MTASAALQPGQSVGDALRAIASQTLSETHAIVTDTARDKAVAVHDFRRSMKRWRSQLRLLEPHLGDAAMKLRTGARDLARSVGAARDASSALEALDDLHDARAVPSKTLSERSLQSVHARLGEIKSAAERKAWSEASRQAILDYVTAASYQVTRWNFAQVTFLDIARGLAETYRRARNALPEEWEEASADELHELRQRVVTHRYQMEIVEPAWPRLGRIWVEEAQRLRTRLGRHQDLSMLARLTMPHQPLAPWRSRLGPTIAKAQSEHVKSSARLATRLFAEPPKAFRRRMEALWEAQTGAEPVTTE